MVSLQDLKDIVLFEGLTEKMLEHVLPLVKTEFLEERQIVYESGAEAVSFYCMKRGKVLLEAELAQGFILSVGAIKQGYSFGWSSLFPGNAHTSYAVCAEPSEILVFSGDGFSDMLAQNNDIGYLVMQKSASILENRLERRTAQFLKVISKHPEIGTLLGT